MASSPLLKSLFRQLHGIQYTEDAGRQLETENRPLSPPVQTVRSAPTGPARRKKEEA